MVGRRKEDQELGQGERKVILLEDSSKERAVDMPCTEKEVKVKTCV